VALRLLRRWGGYHAEVLRRFLLRKHHYGATSGGLLLVPFLLGILRCGFGFFGLLLWWGLLGWRRCRFGGGLGCAGLGGDGVLSVVVLSICSVICIVNVVSGGCATVSVREWVRPFMISGLSRGSSLSKFVVMASIGISCILAGCCDVIRAILSPGVRFMVA